jgi:release factor glutamine methyltransferase
MTVRELAASAADRLKRVRIPDSRREAESLLGHALGKDGAWIVAHPESVVAATKAKAYAAMIARRAGHEPFAYVVGEKWFYGRRFRVTKDVLIPRPETEVLVEATLGSRFRGNDGRGATVLDVGTGSGAIGLTLAAELPKAKIILYDISKKALDVACANARALKLARRVRAAKLDILRQPLPELKSGFTVLAANLPYLPIARWKDAAPEVRGHEPRLALVSGTDGLDHYRALFKRLARWKRLPDLLALEAEPGQFAELRRLTLGLMPDARVDILKDLYGDERVLIASKRKRPVA